LFCRFEIFVEDGAGKTARSIFPFLGDRKSGVDDPLIRSVF